MLKKYLLFVVLLSYGVLSDGPDQCVRYDFEDFDNVFPRDVPHLCSGLPWSWNQGNYYNSTIAAPNEKSKWFIRASANNFYVCTASFYFTITPGGLAEANVYTETISGPNILYFRLFQLTETGVHIRLGESSRDSSVTGWQVMNVTNEIDFTGNPPYRGYIHFSGRSDQGNIMIVDSFRYVPALMDPEKECFMYEDTTTTLAPTETPTPTPAPTTTSTTTTTTISTTSTTTPTDPATTTETTPTKPIITPPNNLTNYFVEELVDYRKSVRISKKRITKFGNINELEQTNGLE